MSSPEQSQVFDIKLHEIDQAAQTLYKAFDHDPLMLWMFVTPENYQKNGVTVFKTWVKYSILYGKAWRTKGFEAVHLVRKPGDLSMSFWRLFRSGMLNSPKLLTKEGFNRLMVMDKQCTQLKKNSMGKQKFWHCWVIGTDPDKQRQGYGGILMQHLFNLAAKDHLPCYLETFDDEAKSAHKHNGYHVVETMTLPNSSLQLTTMLKPLQS